MTGFGADPVELQICGSALTEIRAELSTELTTLRGEMDTLFSTGWHGQAATGFAQGWDDWRAGAETVLAALGSMADLLNDTGRTYSTTDDSSADRLRESGTGL